MNAIEYLSRNGGMLLLGSTALLLLGALAVVIQRSPVHRQRLGELAVLAVLLWLPLASIPMPRLRSGDAEPGNHVLDVPETRMLSSPPEAIVAPPLRAALLEVPAGREKGEFGAPAAPVPEALIRAEETLTSREVHPPAALEPEAPLPGLDALADAPLAGLAVEPPVVPVPWDRIAASCYLVGAAACAAYLALGRLLLSRALRGARKADPWLESLFNSLPAGSRRRSRAQLLVADARIRPLSCGLWRAKVVLPLSTCREERAGELRQVLLHELTHVERRDALGAFVLNLAFPLLYFNPLYWFLRARVRLSAELIADDQAASQSSVEEYAAALIHFVRLSRAEPLRAFGVTGMFRSETQFYRRLHMLLRRDGRLSSRSSRGWRFLSLLLSGSVLALLTAVVGVEPARSQDDAPAEADASRVQLEKERDALNEEIKALREKVRALEGEAAPAGKRASGAKQSPARLPGPRPAGTTEAPGRGRTSPDAVNPPTSLGERVSDDLSATGESQRFTGPLGLDLLQLATAYNDGLGDLEIARLRYQSAAETAARKLTPKVDADVARIRLDTAERKLKILRAIAMAARKATEANLEAKMRAHDKGYVSRDQLIEAEARLDILQQILDTPESTSGRVEKRSPDTSGSTSSRVEKPNPEKAALQTQRKAVQARLAEASATYGEFSDIVKGLKKTLELLEAKLVEESPEPEALQAQGAEKKELQERIIALTSALQARRQGLQESVTAQTAAFGEDSDQVKSLKKRLELLDAKVLSEIPENKLLRQRRENYQELLLDHTAKYGEHSEAVKFFKNRLSGLEAKIAAEALDDATLQAQKNELQKRIINATATHGESSDLVEDLQKLLELIDAKLLLATKDIEPRANYKDLEIGSTQPRRPGPPAQPIEGLLTAVMPDKNLVVLSVGREQNVEVGHEFSICRNGKLIGKVRILKVFPDLSGAEVLSTQEGEEIQRGDRATTSN